MTVPSSEEVDRSWTGHRLEGKSLKGEIPGVLFPPHGDYAFPSFQGKSRCKESIPSRVFFRMSSHTVHDLAGYRQQLLGFAMARLRDRDRAEDAVQEALLAGLEGLGRFSGGSSLRTWLTGILKHKISDALRGPVREEPAELDEFPSAAGCPEAGLSRTRFMEALQRSLEELPPTSRKVFMLRDVLEQDTREVCAQLAITDGHCWVALHRARKRLRECPAILAHR
jgi:RNA polymerase sigma-70 factor, ECF subfamily